MTELSHRNFGLLIAYVIPGLVVVAAAGYFSPTVQSWLTVPERGPTIAGFLYLSLTSIAAGVTVSAVRWAVVDTLHHYTGLSAPNWDFGKYAAKAKAFDAIVEDHYRYYQFYSNMAVALIVLFACHRAAGNAPLMDPYSLAILFLICEVFFIAGSRDALRKYYARGSLVLGVMSEAPKRIAGRSHPHRAPRKSYSTPARRRKSATLTP